MRSFAAAVAATSLLLAAPAAQASVPAWVKAQVATVSSGLGEPNPRIVLVRLNRRENGRLVDKIWIRGAFTCNLCYPRTSTRGVVILDVHTHVVIVFHLSS
jgi:hypothetical protein